METPSLSRFTAGSFASTNVVQDLLFELFGLIEMSVAKSHIDDPSSNFQNAGIVEIATRIVGK